MAQGPNPIEVYEQARAQLRPILAASSTQLGSSTPCTEWTVQSLINHAISVQQFAHDGWVRARRTHPSWETLTILCLPVERKRRSMR